MKITIFPNYTGGPLDNPDIVLLSDNITEPHLRAVVSAILERCPDRIVIELTDHDHESKGKGDAK